MRLKVGNECFFLCFQGILLLGEVWHEVLSGNHLAALERAIFGTYNCWVSRVNHGEAEIQANFVTGVFFPLSYKVTDLIPSTCPPQRFCLGCSTVSAFWRQKICFCYCLHWQLNYWEFQLKNQWTNCWRRKYLCRKYVCMFFLLNYLSACNISLPSGAEAAADFCSLLRPFCNLFSLLEDPRMMEVVGATGTSRGVEAGVTEELVSRKKNPLVGSSKRTSRHSCPEKWKEDV